MQRYYGLRVWISLTFLALALVRFGGQFAMPVKSYVATHVQHATPAAGPSKSTYYTWLETHRRRGQPACFVIVEAGQPLCAGAYQQEASNQQLKDWQQFLRDTHQ